MQKFDGEKILMAWESCRERPAQEGALALLAIAWPEQPTEDLARLPLAKRNALLLELRAVTLGRRMEGFTVCPECGAQLEFILDARKLANELHTPEVEAVGGGLTMRPANTRDLLACLDADDEQQARSIMLARTLGFDEPDEKSDGHGSQEWLESLPETLPADLLKRFDRLNASAEIRVRLQCAVCRSNPLVELDIAQFLVQEMIGAARRLMAEIHQLAKAYGWSEKSIAAMSGVRRIAYLEMLSA